MRLRSVETEDYYLPPGLYEVIEFSSWKAKEPMLSKVKMQKNIIERVHTADFHYVFNFFEATFVDWDLREEGGRRVV